MGMDSGRILLQSFLQTQAYLEDVAGSVPDLCNEANIAIESVTHIFWFPHAYESYVYAMLESTKYATALRLKSSVHTLIKNTLLLKTANHQLNLHQVTVATSKITDHRSVSQI